MNGINPDPYAANRGPQEAPGWLKALAGIPKTIYEQTIGKPYNTVQEPVSNETQRINQAIENENLDSFLLQAALGQYATMNMVNGERINDRIRSSVQDCQLSRYVN